jgi:hypothetical protein
MSIVEAATGGESYKSHKYSMDWDAPTAIDTIEAKRRDTIQWEKTAETSPKREYTNLAGLCKRLSAEHDQVLTYFLDGSRKVYKVDDIALSPSAGRSVIYPVIGGQIGVGCCKRVNKRMQKERFLPEMVVSLPEKANVDRQAGFFQAMTLKINDSLKTGSLQGSVQFAGVLPYKTGNLEAREKFEDKATACVQDRMIELEQKLVETLVSEGKLNQDNYLVKDGSLEYQLPPELKKDEKKRKLFRHNYAWVLGASKQFDPTVCKDEKGKDNPGFIAKLPLYHRTPVACFKNIDFHSDTKYAVWYVRLRNQKHTSNPFDGVLKIEKILVSDDEIEYGMDSELVDRLSAEIINERNPVCYGSDLRWANHIYPIFLTESWVKSKYLSEESFLQLF